MEIIESLPYIRSYTLVVECESFALAARKLSISKPTISKQINKLESILGFQLLVRTTRKMSVTDSGRMFYDQCKKILEGVDETQDLLSEMHRAPKGRLKVVAGRNFAKMYITPHLKEFLKLYPGILLELELAERIPDLERENIDVLIGMSLSAEGLNVIQKKIGSTRYAYTASPKYLKSHGQPKNLKELANHQYISHSMRTVVESTHPCLLVNDVETMLSLAADGTGIIKTHLYVVEEAIKKGDLVEILKEASKETLPIYVAYSQRRFLSSKIRCFIDFVLKNLKPTM